MKLEHAPFKKVGEGPTSRFDETILSLQDPDGLALELVAHPQAQNRPPWKEGTVPAEHAIRGIHTATLLEEGYERTAKLLTETLGFRPLSEENNVFRYEVGEGGPGAYVDVRCAPGLRRGLVAAGTVHHVACGKSRYSASRGASIRMRTMQIISQLTNIVSCEPTVLTIGFFDGVHRGHQHVIRHVINCAVQQGARAQLVTFWPHPQRVLHPEKPKPLLTTLEEKLELLAALGGLDTVVVMPFTAELARLTPREYLERLRSHFQLQTLIVGADFALGHNRTGNITWLQNAGKELSFTVETFTITAGDSRISSTRIRKLVAAGRIEEAADLLGRPYNLVGRVIRGNQRGYEREFPTANLLLDPVKLLPANGVYAVRVRLPDDERASRLGVAYVSRRPNLREENPVYVEVHLLDVHIDLYGHKLGIEFVAWLGKEQHFHSIQARQAQMRVDVDRVRRLLTTSPL